MIFRPLRILCITIERFLYVIYVMLLIRSMVYSNCGHRVGNFIVCLLRWRRARWFWYRSTTSILAQIFEFLWAGCGRFSRWRWFWFTFLGSAFIIVHCWFTATWCIWGSFGDANFRWMTESIYMQLIPLITIHTIFTSGPRIRFGHIFVKFLVSFFFCRNKPQKLNANDLLRNGNAVNCILFDNWPCIP